MMIPLSATMYLAAGSECSSYSARQHARRKPAGEVLRLSAQPPSPAAVLPLSSTPKPRLALLQTGARQAEIKH
eukprot:277898-Rhodomonas_salina.1